MNNISNKKDYMYKRLPKKYVTLLDEIQGNLNDNLWELHQGNIDETHKKEKVMSFILKQLHDKNAEYQGYTMIELANRIYDDIERYSVLTKPLEDDNVEGININSWRDIKVKFTDGTSIKIGGFCSPQQAIDIHKRLLQNSNVTIDNAIPTAEASINSTIRIVAVQSPILDEDIAVACYIRKLRDKVFSSQEYIESGFATDKELNLIRTCARRGVSILFVGKVNTGKTTVLKHTLYSLPDEMQIITIESGTREFNLIKENEFGEVINNVIHMLTKESEVESQNITQEKLVVKALKLNPDVVSVAEMRDIEAYAAQEAALAGFTVISTTHAGSIQQGHKRVASLCRKKYPTDYHTALVNSVEAFPLVVYIHTTDDNVRRIMNISESYVDGKDEVHYNTLWEYQIEENIQTSNGVTVLGKHKQIKNPTDYLKAKMKQYGATGKELKSLEMEV